jgi:hypothetical protein
LEEFAGTVDSEDINKASCDLREFFALRSGKVHWLVLGDKRCIFYSAPLDITGLVAKVLKDFPKIAFVDSLGSEKILSYYRLRLGLKNFKN